MSKGSRTRIEQIRDCGDGQNQVVTVIAKNNGKPHNRVKPCEQCPWRSDLPTGVFPAEAFRHSAPTAYDAADSQFACHMSGVEGMQTCAGFLLRNADNNIGTRLSIVAGRYRPVSDGGFPLYESYRAMAIANGVSPDDPVLEPCRANGEPWKPTRRQSNDGP